MGDVVPFIHPKYRALPPVPDEGPGTYAFMWDDVDEVWQWVKVSDEVSDENEPFSGLRPAP